MFSVNKQGGTRSKDLHQEAIPIWLATLRLWAFIQAIHILRSMNREADRLNRTGTLSPVWSLDPVYLKPIFALWGILGISQFTTQLNSKAPEFFSLGNAFQLFWEGILFYAFTPFLLLIRIIEKARRDKSEIILVTPFWPSKSDFQVLWRSQGWGDTFIYPSL